MKKVISYINPQKLMAVFIDGGGGEVLFSYAFLSKDSLPMSEDKESFAPVTSMSSESWS